MKHVYIVMGGGGSGKSSLIRSLTGLYKPGSVNIRLSPARDVRFKVWIRSEQENEHGKNIPSKTLNDILSAAEDHVIIALRIDAIGAYPDGIDYVNLIESHPGCIIEGIIVMQWHSIQPISFPLSITNIVHIPNCRSNPVNVNASIARGAWHWV